MRCLFSVVGVLVATSAALAQTAPKSEEASWTATYTRAAAVERYGESFVSSLETMYGSNVASQKIIWAMRAGDKYNMPLDAQKQILDHTVVSTADPEAEKTFWNAQYSREGAVQRFGEPFIAALEAIYGPRGASFNVIYAMRVGDQYGVPLDEQKKILDLSKNTCALCRLRANNPNKITQEGCIGINCGVVQRNLDRWKLGMLPWMLTAQDQEVKPGIGTAAKQQVAGVGMYGLAYALKGVIRAVVNWDWNELEVHAYQLQQPGFWGSALLFGVTSQTAQTITQAAASRLPASVVKAVPTTVAGASKLAAGGAYMALGMGAVQYALTGNVDLRDLAITTASYMAAGVAVNLLVDAVALAVLGATPAGWLFIVAKLALTLYFGEELSTLLRRWLSDLDEKVDRAAAWFDGVRHKIEAIEVR